MGGDLTQVLRRPVELAEVKRTLLERAVMSASDPQRSSAEGRLRERSGIFRTVNEPKGGNVG